MDKEDIKLCNCAGCRKKMLGESMEEWYETLSEFKRRYQPNLVAGRVDGRPYCKDCLHDIRKRKRVV